MSDEGGGEEALDDSTQSLVEKSPGLRPGSANPRWGLDWAKMALACVKSDDADKLKVYFEKLNADEINTPVSKGLVGYGMRFHFVYDIPLSLSVGIQLGDTLLDLAHRKGKSAKLRATIRELGGRAFNEVEAEAAEIDTLEKQARRAELEAEGRI
mmetsp:Transcript_39134/g.79031  ORF Transcript_39134/g.79031 Transcript_39134/m.79031 type:complete len:155 (+) Transcript_39134:136-600(+)